MPWAIEQRDLRRGRQDEVVRRDREGPRRPARPRRPPRAAAAFAAGSSSGAATGRPIPNPGMAALPHASAGSSARCPRPAPRRGPPRSPGRRAARSGPSPEVGRDRVGEVGEREGPADDRDRVARLEPALAIGPVAAPIAQPRLAGSGRRAPGPSSSSATASARSISANRVDPPAPDVETGRLVPGHAGLALEADRRIEPRPAREDPQAARRVADAKADRALLRVARVGRPPVAAVADRRAVVDAGHALEERHEGHLGRLDDAADPDLADGQRRDRRRRDVADAHDRPIAAEPAREQRQAGDDADHRDHAEPRAQMRLHAPIVRDATGQPERRDGHHGDDDQHDPEADERRSATTGRESKAGRNSRSEEERRR